MHAERTAVLSRLTGGVNRFEAEASENQCSEALDVWVREGDLVRRPSFRSVAHGIPFFLASGKTRVVLEYPLLTYNESTSRAPSIDGQRIGGQTGRLWVGCDEPFDGIELGLITSVPTLAASRHLKPMFRNTSGSLVSIYDFVDTTKYRASATIWAPLCRQGTISWHRDQFANWTATVLPTIATAAYWIALDVSVSAVNYNSLGAVAELGAAATNLTIAQPGIRAFLLEPVNGLFPITAGRRPVLVIGSDRRVQRSYDEKGAGLGFVGNPTWPIQTARLVNDEGVAVFSRVTYPSWTGGGGGGTIGDATDEILTKLDSTIDWIPGDDAFHTMGQFDGTVITSGVSLAGGTASFVSVAGYNDSKYEGCIFRATSGARAGEESEIENVDVTGIYLTDALTGALANTDTFEIRTTPNYLRTREGKRNYAIKNNTRQTVTVWASKSYDNAQHASDVDDFVTFEISQHLQHALDAGRQWIDVYDPVSQRHLLLNGRTPILEYDGLRVRKLEALWDDTEGVIGSAAVQFWRGNLQDQALRTQRLDVVSGSLLHREPPLAKLLVDFNGRLVALRHDGFLQWSAPGVDNNIWPFTYETYIRDSENNPIVGMAVLNDRLYAWSKTAIFSTPQADDLGNLNFTTVSHGIGFSGHHSVARVSYNGSSMLVGVTPDGLVAINGGDVTYVIDDWSRILPGGVNYRRLEKSIVCFWQQESIIFVTVSGAGSETNNRIIVIDLKRKTAYPWSTPYGGCTFIASDLESSGHEKILFGFGDGHVCVLQEGIADGNDTVEGYARSQPQEILDGKSFAPVATMIAVSDSGGKDAPIDDFVECLTVKTFMSHARAPAQTTSLKTTVYPTEPTTSPILGKGLFGTAFFPSEGAVTKRFPCPSGLSGEAFAFEIRGIYRWRFSGARLLFTEKSDR